MGASDLIQFSTEPAGAVFLRQPWLGTWPPPAAIGLLLGKESGQVHRLITDPIGEVEARMHVEDQGFVFDELYRIDWYDQTSASEISDEDIATMSHVARVAAYAPRGSTGHVSGDIVLRERKACPHCSPGGSSG